MPARKATIYPQDALMGRDDTDVISPDIAPTLDAMFRERVRRNPGKEAYCEFDFDTCSWRDYTWRDIAVEVDRWRSALKAEGLSKGDRVALRLRNGRHWVMFDQAALSLGLVVVPLYVADRPDNVTYVLAHSGSKLLLLEHESAWLDLQNTAASLPELRRVVILGRAPSHNDNLLRSAYDWVNVEEKVEPEKISPDDLASIVYTSGTTGRPKGVMLSHRNMLSNAYSGLRSVAMLPIDILLSFLPLSHTLERTVGYYMPIMAGAKVAYNRSIPQLPEDFLTICPTGIVTVPRIFERVYSKLNTQFEKGPHWKKWLFDIIVDIGWRRFEHRQGRANWQWRFLLWPILDFLIARRVRMGFGDRMRLAAVGGAPLPPPVSRVFIALGLDLLQGYGLTESSPCISINTLGRNRPSSIGLPVHDVEVKIGENDELLARGPNIMMGYWGDGEATKQALNKNGWLHTGDQARIDEDGFISIIGRIKEILVLANGEKVPPADVESAISEDALFEQSMVIGEHMPYLTALVVLNEDLWRDRAITLGMDSKDQWELHSDQIEKMLVERIAYLTRDFPGYASIRRVTAMLVPWTVENGLLTPTLKLKRAKIHEQFRNEIAKMYEGHGVFN